MEPKLDRHQRLYVIDCENGWVIWAPTAARAIEAVQQASNLPPWRNACRRQGLTPESSTDQ